MKSDKKLKKHKNNLSRKKINLVHKKKQVRKKSNSRKNSKLRNKKNKSKKKKKMKGGAQNPSCVEMFKDMKILDIEEYMRCFLYEGDVLDEDKIQILINYLTQLQDRTILKLEINKLIEYIYENYDLVEKEKKFIVHIYISILKKENKFLKLNLTTQLKLFSNIIKQKGRFNLRPLNCLIKILNIMETQFIGGEYITIEEFIFLVFNFPILINTFYYFLFEKEHKQTKKQGRGKRRNFSTLNDFKNDSILRDFKSFEILNKNPHDNIIKLLNSLFKFIKEYKNKEKINSLQYNFRASPIIKILSGKQDEFYFGMEIEGCLKTPLTIEEHIQKVDGDDDEYFIIYDYYFKKEIDYTVTCNDDEDQGEYTDICVELILEKSGITDETGPSGYTLADVPNSSQDSVNFNRALNLIQEKLTKPEPCKNYSCGLHYHISHKQLRLNTYSLLVLIYIIQLWISKHQTEFMRELKYQKNLINSETDDIKRNFSLFSKENFFYTDTEKYLKIMKDWLKKNKETSITTIKDTLESIYHYLQEITKDFDGDKMQLTVVEDINLIHLEFRGMYPIELAKQTVKFKQLVIDLWQEAITETNIFLGAAGAE